MNYNVTTGKKLVIGYKYDAGGDSIVFTGYTKKEDESVVYLKFYNGENYLIPLVDMAVEIGSPLTDKTGVFPMQLVEILDGALIKNSPVWYGVVKNSLDQSTVTEVTTPELNLVYAQMYEAYQNILEIQETLVTAQNFDDMMAEYLEDHTIPVGVTSVNGLYGDVVLGAGQVGAIPAETVTQEDTTSSAAPGSEGTFEAVAEVYRNEYGQITGVDTVTVTMPTIPAETSRTDTTSTASTNIFNVIDEIETNEYGHVTAVNTKTVTVPSSGGGGGGTGAGEFVITVTKSGNTYTADRTGGDILAAMEDGLVPILLEASNAVSGLAYHLSAYSQNLWVFDRPMSATKVAEFVLQGATPTITYTELTQTVDNALSSTSTNPVQNQAITTAISGLTADDIQDDSTVTTSGTVKDALRALSDEIASLSGGAPTPAATVSEMVDTTKIYLYTGSETGYTAGHWYYYSGGQWVDGGRYGEAASMSAGVKEALLACFRNVAWTSESGQTYYDNLYNELYPPANLASISCVYTQTVTVYTDTSLEDLRNDLVVTAHFDDSSSRTISQYVLNGTLEVGTSTITVTYGGKTTTFDVTVSRGLDYTADALADVTWNTGKGYGTTTGNLIERNGAYTTDKFTVQDLSYSVKNLDTTNNTSFFIYVWDENGTFLGNKQYSDARFQWKPEYQIAIEVRNAGTFDPTTMTMLPCDKRATAVSEFEIDLASMANSVVKANGYYELNVNAVMANAGVNSSNYNDAINRQSIVGMINQSVRANNFPFKTPIRIGIFNYGTNMLLSINVEGIAVSDANLPTLKAYLVDNNVKIKYNY